MHKHEWTEAQISNGAQTKKAKKTSEGARCACKLTAKAPSKPDSNWLKNLPK